MENTQRNFLTFDDLIKNILESENEDDFIEKIEKTMKEKEKRNNECNPYQHKEHKEHNCNCKHNENEFEKQENLKKINLVPKKENVGNKNNLQDKNLNENKKYTFKTNIYHYNDEIEILSELPGIDVNNISIEITEDKLTIDVKTGYKAQFNEDRIEDIICVQKESNDFLYCGGEGLAKKIFTIKNIEKMKVTATYKNGLLSIHLKNLQPQPKNKIKIQII